MKNNEINPKISKGIKIDIFQPSLKKNQNKKVFFFKNKNL